MNTFDIDGRPVGPGEPTFIIAEAGSNHNGDLETAKELIDVAVDAGADAVKFQTFRANRMYPRNSGKLGTADDDAYSVLESLEMPYDWIPALAERARSHNIIFLSSPFDKKSADVLEQHVPAYKLGSTMVSHHPFLRYIAEKGKPLIVSTGAHSMDDIEEMMTVLSDSSAEAVVLLQCVSAYPTSLEKINVSVLNTLHQQFEVPTGLSDHTEDPTSAPVVAASLDAAVIEKHITLDNTMDGPDHSFALEPNEFAQLVTAVRTARKTLGDGYKEILDIENETYENGRRCLFAARDLSSGETLTSQDLAWLRPGGNQRGIPATECDVVTGYQVLQDIERGESISWNDLSKQ